MRIEFDRLSTFVFFYIWSHKLSWILYITDHETGYIYYLKLNFMCN